MIWFKKTKFDCQLTQIKILAAVFLLLASGFAKPDAAADFNSKVFDLQTAMALPDDNITTPQDATNFATEAEQALALMANYQPTPFNLMNFSKALSDATGVSATNPLQAQSARIQSVYNRVVDYQAGKTIDFGTGTTGSTAGTTTTGFVDLKAYITTQKNQLRTETSMTQTEAETFANSVFAAVDREAPGIIDPGVMSIIKTNITSMIGSPLLTKSDKVTPLDGKQNAVTTFNNALNRLNNIKISDCVDYLADHVWDSNDKAFAPGTGETRLLQMMEYISESFSSLSTDDKNVLRASLEGDALARDDFSQTTKNNINTYISGHDWGSTTTTTTSSATTTTVAAAADPMIARLNQLNPPDFVGAMTDLNNMLIALDTPDKYETFFGYVEALVNRYTALAQAGQIKTGTSGGQTPDAVVAAVANFTKNVAENYRFSASPYHDKVTALYNLAIGNLSLDQKIDQYSIEQNSVKNDVDAQAFVQKIKSDLIFNPDGTLKDSFKQLTESDKDTLCSYVNSLKSANFFGAASSDLDNIITTVRSGLGVDQLIAAISDTLSKVTDISSLDSFMVALRDLKGKFDVLRAKGDISDAQRKSFIAFFDSTQDSSRFWRLRQGPTKVELMSMEDSLKNPLSMDQLITSLQNALIDMKAHPDSVSFNDVQSMYNRTSDLVDQWQFSRILGLPAAANNAALLALLSSLSATDDFFDYKSNFASMTTRVQTPIAQDAKIQSIFGYADKVLSDDTPAPQSLENVIKSIEFLATAPELALLTSDQKTTLRAKISLATNKTSTDTASKARLTAADQIIAGAVAPAATTATTTATTPVTTTPATSNLTAGQSSTAATVVASATSTQASTAQVTAPASGVVATRNTAAAYSLTSQRAPVQSGERTSSVVGLAPVASSSRVLPRQTMR